MTDELGCGLSGTDTTPTQPHRMEHYAEAFCLTSGQCLRLIRAEDGTVHAQHCPYAVV